MSSIYDQHDKAFKNVSAYVVLRETRKSDDTGTELERVATIAFKFPRDGAGRLYAYVHWLGTEMVRGHANGYGYDKKSAACESAVDKLARNINCEKREFSAGRVAFLVALSNIGGSTWDRRLQDAGFTVLQAV